MEEIECQNCVFYIEAIKSCLLHREHGKPKQIRHVNFCSDHQLLQAPIENYLSELPTNLAEDLALDNNILSLFVQLVLTQQHGSSPPFWFFSDPYYPDPNEPGCLEICDYRGYSEVELILRVLGYSFDRPAGMVRNIHFSNADRREFFETFGKYYTVASSVIQRYNWKIKGV